MPSPSPGAGSSAPVAATASSPAPPSTTARASRSPACWFRSPRPTASPWPTPCRSRPPATTAASCSACPPAPTTSPSPGPATPRSSGWSRPPPAKAPTSSIRGSPCSVCRSRSAPPEAPSSEGASLAVPAGALSSSQATSLTVLSEQALPALLPYGFSPRGAAYVALGASFASPATLTIPVDTAIGREVIVASLDFALLQWKALAVQTVAGSSLQIAISQPGAYVVIEADPESAEDLEPTLGQVLPSADRAHRHRDHRRHRRLRAHPGAAQPAQPGHRGLHPRECGHPGAQRHAAHLVGAGKADPARRQRTPRRALQRRPAGLPRTRRPAPVALLAAALAARRQPADRAGRRRRHRAHLRRNHRARQHPRPRRRIGPRQRRRRLRRAGRSL